MKSFEDLDRAELYRSAIEDFAVDVPENANKKELIAAFVETGITWKDYVAQHPEVAPKEEEKFVDRETEPVRPGAVVTSAAVKGEVPEKKEEIIVAQPAVQATGKYLIKMTRDNTIYETRGYRFTKEHPYALVEPEDASYILEVEDGFRQALPSELADFYS
jgi:hypothetical protein